MRLGTGSHGGLRGDYSRVAPDFTIDQDWAAYSEEDHTLWRILYRRQSALARRYACTEYVEALAHMDVAEGVPEFARASQALRRATGWEIVAVPGLLPDDVFFSHLAARRFPVTVWMRRRDELDYLAEPDLFHDFFGHVPLLLNPVFADYMQAYGRKGAEAISWGGLAMLARLYWYMVEFGLIETSAGLRAFGAGMLSSAAELPHSIDDPQPRRIRFDLERVMTTGYVIDSFQQTYFVLRSFDELFRATQRDFRPLYAGLAAVAPSAPGAAAPGDVTLPTH